MGSNKKCHCGICNKYLRRKSLGVHFKSHAKKHIRQDENARNRTEPFITLNNGSTDFLYCFVCHRIPKELPMDEVKRQKWEEYHRTVCKEKTQEAVEEYLKKRPTPECFLHAEHLKHTETEILTLVPILKELTELPEDFDVDDLVQAVKDVVVELTDAIEDLKAVVDEKENELSEKDEIIKELEASKPYDYITFLQNLYEVIAEQPTYEEFARLYEEEFKEEFLKLAEMIEDGDIPRQHELICTNICQIIARWRDNTMAFRYVISGLVNNLQNIINIE